MQFDHVAICVEDIERSVIWYRENLDACILYVDKTWAMLQIGSTKLALTSRGQHPPHVAFLVDDFKEQEKPKKHRDGSNYIYKSDPDGNTIELIKYTD